MLRLLAYLTTVLIAAAQSGAPPSDERYPAMAAWAGAGVIGGIPALPPVVARLNPGDDLQAAIDVAAASGGTIALRAGEYPITQTLRLRSGVVLQGTGPRTTKLRVMLRGSKPTAEADRLAAWPVGIAFDSVTRAGLSRLTVTQDAPNPPPDPRADRHPDRDNPAGLTDLGVVAIGFTAATDCWLHNCVIRDAGSHPLMIEGSRHLTIDDVEIRGAHDRGRGSGSLNLVRSESVLFTGLQVADINCVILQGGTTDQPCRHNVFIGARLEVDVRFHDPGTMHNLLENCVIAVPRWHNRPPLWQGRAEEGVVPPGPGNLVYLCTVTREFPAGGRNFSTADDPTQVYQILEAYSREGSVRIAGPAPAGSTLWPVR